MSQVLGISVLTNIRKSLTLTGFLRKISYTKAQMQGAAGEKKFTQGITRLLDNRDYSVQSLFPVVKEAFGPLGRSENVDLDMIYDYLVLKVDEDARDRVFTKEERDFIIIFIAIYEVMLKSEEASGSDAFYITHGFQFLTKKEVQVLENEEYKRFMKAFKEDHIYALMKMSRDLKGYNTLDHVVGVHHVGMFIARQLKSLGLPIDLGRVSGALAGHDIGKYGVKLNEMRRVPYLHYYYSDIWFKKHGIDYIRNVAVNHSTWDLELENLSLEALVLIYSDFRVKNRNVEGKEQMFIYPLDESFHVILEKLDNVDEAKKRRYERVYAKLEDFENYLKSLGVEVAVSGKEENRKILESRRTIRTLKKPAICFGDEIIDRLKYHAI
ncbi:MAG: cytidyltransferase, partial [Clostridia bacterium]|nr:cytidyltransferase [Clostridia bacterium]